MVKHRTARFILLSWLLLSVAVLPSRGVELNFSDFNNQGVFNHFSGDSGAFASGQATVSGTCDTQVLHGTNGASLRLDYSVESGFCGLWKSLLGKGAFPRHSLNFTNLYGALQNSSSNPSRVEGVQVTNFSFWARGNGQGEFEHQLKIEFKNTGGLVSNALFSIPNSARWQRYDLPIRALGPVDLSQMKELTFVIEDWRNNKRPAGTVYLDDLAFTTDEPATDPSRWGDDTMLDVISHRAFSYFLRFTDDLGFALDRSTFSDMVSVGTIGFQLTAYCIGHQRDWADKEDLEKRVATILRNLSRLPMGGQMGTNYAGCRGFYYHFLSANSGLRKDENVELSLYDTMLLMYGILTCQEYFPQNQEIQRLSRELFDRVEWDWFVDQAPGPNRNQFHLDWHPEPAPSGTFHKHVDGQTDEALMVDVLALGSRTHPVSAGTCFARTRVFGHYPQTNREPILVSWRGSMFNYFFASGWLNFESRGIDLHPFKPMDIWRNNKIAIEANLRFCIDHSSSQPGQTNNHYTSYGPQSWGLTACDNLVPPHSSAPSEYFSFGALPTEENARFGTRALHAGTIAVYGAGSSIDYTPVASIAALRHYFAIPNLWSPLFGFGDAFSLDPHYLGSPYDVQGNPTILPALHLNGPWINSMSMGVNVGPMLLAIENYRSAMLWNLTARNSIIARGLDRIFGLGTVEHKSIAINPHASHRTVTLQWKANPGASAYAVFASMDLTNWTLLKTGIESTDWTDDRLPNNTQRFYLIKALR
jgi:hypothetical protein